MSYNILTGTEQPPAERPFVARVVVGLLTDWRVWGILGIAALYDLNRKKKR